MQGWVLAQDNLVYFANIYLLLQAAMEMTKVMATPKEEVTSRCYVCG